MSQSFMSNQEIAIGDNEYCIILVYFPYHKLNNIFIVKRPSKSVKFEDNKQNNINAGFEVDQTHFTKPGPTEGPLNPDQSLSYESLQRPVEKFINPIRTKSAVFNNNKPASKTFKTLKLKNASLAKPNKSQKFKSFAQTLKNLMSRKYQRKDGKRINFNIHY